MTVKPTFVDFDQLIYLQFDHAPGYAQWWVMLNLGHATAPDGKGNSIILQRFRRREDAEEYKARIKHGCIVCNEPEHLGWMPVENQLPTEGQEVLCLVLRQYDTGTVRHWLLR